MVDILQSSVTVSFGEDNKTNSGDLIWEEDTARTSQADNEMYLRLYPGTPEVLIKTSGTLVGQGGDVEDVTDLIVFSGSTEQTIKYPQVPSVVISTIGSTYDEEGLSIRVNFSYNAAKRSIVADVACYGVVEVTYTAPYELYLFTFYGDPCKLSYVNNIWTQVGGYTPSYIVALNPTKDTTASIQLTPDRCGENASIIFSGKDSGPVNIVLEVHKDFPPRIVGSGLDGVGLGCKVRQIPAVPADIDMSSGQYTQESFANSSATSKRGDNIYLTNNYIPAYTEVVKEMLQFNVSYSQKLKYQPAGNISVRPTGAFLDAWGNRVSPSFAKPGDTVIEVEWVSAHVYRNPKRRVVNPDEIVAVTAGNKTVDIYGSAAIDYSIQFKVFNVAFKPNDKDRPEDGWETIHMTAKYDGQTEYLEIVPESLKEK